MTKKIAVLVRDRQSEALRMAVGVILLDDEIDVYVLDRPLEKTEQIELYAETLHDLEMNVYTNCRENKDFKYLSNEDIANKLTEYDHVVAY